MRDLETINKELSDLYKEREKVLIKSYKHLVGKSFKVNGVYYHVTSINKNDFVGLRVEDGDVTLFSEPIKMVLQWTEELTKEDFVTLLKETHEFQLQSIGETE